MKFAHLSIGLLTCLTPFAAAWSKEDREIFRVRDEIIAHEPNPEATFYDILGISQSASQDEINKAYRLKSRSLHPDKVAQQLRKDRAKASKENKDAKIKPPTQGEIKAVVKKASEAQTRLGLIAQILRGPGRERYDHFLSNGFPLWKGTDYYYNRYRPGLGTVLTGLFLVGGGAIHYLILYMNWKRQKEFVERYVKFAREKAWGGSLGIPIVEAAPAPPSAEPTDGDDSEPPMPMNRRQRRMQEKESKREGNSRSGSKKPRRAPAQTPSPASTGPTAGPTGARKRVVAENGKVLVVDSLGDVYLEDEDEEGNVHEFLLDPNEIAQPTFRDTAVVQAPFWLFQLTVGRFLPGKNEQTVEDEEEVEDGDSDVQQPTPSDSAGEDFELLDKSTDSLSKAKVSGAQQAGKASKRKNKKR